MRMARSVGAVAAGVAGWSVLWVAAGVVPQASGRFSPGERVDDPVLLWGLVALSVLLSLAAGAVTAALAGGARRTAHALACGGVLLALGLAFEIAAWSSTPVWYHLVFLALLAPACAAGGAAIAQGRSS